MNFIKSVFFKDIKKVLLLIAALLLIYSMQRLIFFWYNISYFPDISSSEIIICFLGGLVFDLSAIFSLNFLFITIFFFPYINKNAFLTKVNTVLFFIINGIGFLANLCDVAYFPYTFKRTTYDVFAFISKGNEVLSLLPQFIIDFWFVPVLTALFIGILYLLCKKLFTNYQRTHTNLVSQIIVFILFIFISITCVRGGWGLRPINIINTAKYTDSRYVSIVLNTPFCIIKTAGKQSLQKKNYFSNEECNRIYSPFQQNTSSKSFQKKNVVILILESFGKEYIGYYNPKVRRKYTPFLDSLMNHSLVFNQAYSNGKKSIEGIPSIVAGIPSLMDSPFILSMYSSNQYKTLASILKENAYNSSFFHGANNGSLGLDAFAKMSGFDNYYGKTEYNNNDFDSKWGIFDEPFLQFFAKKQNTMKQPFFNVLFTLSSHHPYTIPEQYKNKFPKGELPILESIAYTDFALKQYFNSIKNQAWFKNTLFVITADHSAQAMDDYFKTKTGMYSIPIVFYSPLDTINSENNTIIEQIDIMPSILGYLGYDKTLFSFGRNVFSEKELHFAINYSDGNYQLIMDNYSLTFNGSETVSLYNTKNDSLQKNDLKITEKEKAEKLSRIVKAFVQQYNNRLIENKIKLP
ncbi:MAG: LTA synthase family protein [Bacteroidota bacterium]